MGFVRMAAHAAMGRALTSPFHPYPRRGGLFSVALSPDHSGPPLAAILSLGVRTFLSPQKRRAVVRSPSMLEVTTKGGAVQRSLAELAIHIFEVTLLLLFEVLRLSFRRLESPTRRSALRPGRQKRAHVEHDEHEREQHRDGNHHDRAEAGRSIRSHPHHLPFVRKRSSSAL